MPARGGRATLASALLPLLVAPGPTSSTAAALPECESPGTLSIYTMESEVGTVASCEHRNAAGVVTKRAHYRLRGLRHGSGSVQEADLVLQQVDEFRYDEQGRLERSDTFDGKRVLTHYIVRSYPPGLAVVFDTFRADGARLYRTIVPEQGPRTRLTFDDSGELIVGVDGPLPDGIELPYGWGLPAAGISCGAVPSAQGDSLERVRIHVNLRNHSDGDLQVPVGAPEVFIDLTLRDADGRLVPKLKSPIRSEGAPKPSQTRAVPPKESIAIASVALGATYAGVPPGRYRLSIEVGLEGWDLDLRCNDLPLRIVGAPAPSLP